MDYKFLFLVGSSLEHFQEKELSEYNTEQRFLQTLETIQSIRTKVPNSYICLFECSYKSIPEKYKSILKEKADLFLELYDDYGMKIIYENIKSNPNLMIFGKSLLETRGLLCALYHIKEQRVFMNAQRIFKLTGRYLLTDEFDIKDYESKLLESYYVAKVFEYSKNENDIMDGQRYDNFYAFAYKCSGSMVTGLWSFDNSLLNETIKALEKSFVYMEKMIQCTTGIDIEHSLYYYIDKNKIIKTSNLGVNIIKGMKGQYGGNYNL
jgi:hypothetical protein